MQKIINQFFLLFIIVDRLFVVYLVAYFMFVVEFTFAIFVEDVLLGSTADDFPSIILMTFPYVVGLTKMGLGYSYSSVC